MPVVSQDGAGWGGIPMTVGACESGETFGAGGRDAGGRDGRLTADKLGATSPGVRRLGGMLGAGSVGPADATGGGAMLGGFAGGGTLGGGGGSGAGGGTALPLARGTGEGLGGFSGGMANSAAATRSHLMLPKGATSDQGRKPCTPDLSSPPHPFQL